MMTPSPDVVRELWAERTPRVPTAGFDANPQPRELAAFHSVPVNYFRDTIKKLRPNCNDAQIDAAVVACTAHLPASEVADKLKACVLWRLDDGNGK